MQLVVPHARVVRDGQDREVDSRDLVPGDIVLLESGVRVPADLRLVTSDGAAGGRVVADRGVGPGRQGRRIPSMPTPCCRTARAWPTPAPPSPQAEAQASWWPPGTRTELGAIAGLMRAEDSVGHAAAAAHGPVRQGHRCGRRCGGAGRVRQRRCPGRVGRGHVPGRRGPRGVRRARGPPGRGDDHLGRRGAAHGAPQRHHPSAPGGRDTGQHDGHRLRQDGDPHREPDDGAGDLDPGTAFHPRRRRPRRRVPRGRRVRRHRGRSGAAPHAPRRRADQRGGPPLERR